MSLGLRV